MAGNIATYYRTVLLKALKNESPAVAAVYVKLHTSEPGLEGTANAAGETTRKAVTWAAPSGGAIKNSAAMEWTSVSTSETYKGVSLWDASTAGNCLIVGPLEAEKTVSAGDTFKIAVEGLAVSLT